MLQLHGQRLRPERRQRRLTDPNCLYYRYGDYSRTRTPYVQSGRSRRRSDRTNGITANVSGKKFFFTTRLLAKYPQSLLGHKHKRKYFYDCIRDEYFFDRNRTAFESIFNFYVSRGTLVVPDESFPEQLLMDEFYFFGLYEYVSDNDKKSLITPSALKKRQIAPKRRCQREVWKISENPDSSVLARLINLFSLLVIIFSAIILFIDTLPDARRSESSTFNSPTPTKNSSNASTSATNPNYEQLPQIISAMESFCIAWFTLELLTRFFVSPEKMKFFLQALNLIDLIAIVPFYISLIIDMRMSAAQLYIMRILRLSRVFSVLKISRTTYYCEQWDADTSFNSIPTACWWALITITTLGYGDLVPTTLGGKITGGMCSVSGVLLITPFLPIIFNKFNRFQELEKECSTAAKNNKSHPPITTVYTQYEINDKYLKRKIRRRYTM
ncbi:shaker-related potassium channel tsha2-like isoform X2 [Porites lutea]|uniref:shaker-related potassium channel tsha2-like isoform X2 n=1 Tax=Porites lutea TaxID=51062 RepID=UPI003CC6A825